MLILGGGGGGGSDLLTALNPVVQLSQILDLQNDPQEGLKHGQTLERKKPCAITKLQCYSRLHGIQRELCYSHGGIHKY